MIFSSSTFIYEAQLTPSYSSPQSMMAVGEYLLFHNNTFASSVLQLSVFTLKKKHTQMDRIERVMLEAICFHVSI